METGPIPLRILVADPSDLVAEGLAIRLSALDRNVLVVHAGTGSQVLDRLSQEAFDLVLLEVSLPGKDGIDTMRTIRKEQPSLPVLAHSTLTDIEYVNSMLIEGASGYLVKGGGTDELLKAIRAVMAGERYLSPQAEQSVERGYAYTEKEMGGEYIGLTAREREIIRLIALERTNGEIAAALFISEDTVKTHRKHVMAKLNVRSAAGLVKYAIDRRWI
jgi:DNA-binding NarL/FixJ family response regulator